MVECYIGLYVITKHYCKGLYSLQGNIIPRASGTQLKSYIDQPDFSFLVIYVYGIASSNYIRQWVWIQ